MPDPFEGSGRSSSYSVDKFYTASRNKKGFGSTVRVTVSPELVAAIGKLIASRKIPEYTTPGDFYRDCLVHRLKYIEQKIGDDTTFAPSRLAEMLMALEYQERIAEEREARAKFVHQIRDNLNNAEDTQVRREVIAHVQRVHDTTRDRLLKEELAKFLR